MKHFFNINKQLRKCEGLLFSFWLWACRSWLGSLCVRVCRAAADFLIASTKASTNNRTYAGLILIGVVTPLTGVAFRYFDHEAVIPGFGYYTNWFWLFYVIGPHIQMLLTLTGVFLIMPTEGKHSQRSYFLSVPAGYSLAKIIWLAQVTTDAEIRQDMPFAYLTLGLSTGVLWLMMSDYLMSLHYHKKAGCLARAEGLLKLDEKQIDRKTQIGLALLEIVAYKNMK